MTTRSSLILFSALTAFFLGGSATNIAWSDTPCPSGEKMEGNAACSISIANSESGFIEIEAITYNLIYDDGKKKEAHTTTPARIWYSYHPHEKQQLGEDTSKKPIFVMLNGGPGGATSSNLFANNTAPYTLNPKSLKNDEDKKRGYGINEYSWTKLGHALYIDAPLTGFSYNLGPKGVNEYSISGVIKRKAEFFERGNFNPFIDAAQVLRVVLRFLDSHRDLIGNPVVLVGESYGGTRVSIMLNLLLYNSERYGNVENTSYRDPKLVEEIEKHFKLLDKNIHIPVTKESVAAQFGRQILIQPQLASYQTDVQGHMYWDEGNSIIDKIAARKHNRIFDRSYEYCESKHMTYKYKAFCPVMAYIPGWNVDPYNSDMDKNWSDNLTKSAVEQLTTLNSLNTILGTDVAKIKGFSPTSRRTEVDKTGKSSYRKLSVLLEGDKNTENSNETEASDIALAKRAGGLSLGILQSEKYIDSQLDENPRTGSLEKQLGTLNYFDSYFTAMSLAVYGAFEINGWFNADENSSYGKFFLENARYVQTFLTHAEKDLVIYSPALPLALEKYETQVSNVECEVGNDNNPGRFEIHYKNPTQTVKLYYPYYAKSGHAVSATQPDMLFNDVGKWLECSSKNNCVQPPPHSGRDCKKPNPKEGF